MTLQQNGFRLYVNIDIKTQGEDQLFFIMLLCCLYVIVSRCSQCNYTNITSLLCRYFYVVMSLVKTRVKTSNNPLTNKKHIVHCFMKIECCTTSCKTDIFVRGENLTTNKKSRSLKNSILVPKLGNCVLSPSPSVMFPCFSVMISVYLSSLYTGANKTNWLVKNPRNTPAFPMSWSSSTILLIVFTFTMVHCVIRPSEDTEKKFMLLSKSSFCHFT